MAQRALAATCLACDQPLAPGDVVCSACGSPLRPAQRRVVVVMFVDLAGYTALCETRDPETVHLLVRPLMNSMRRACEELGGVVPSIEGDGFWTVFGARDADGREPDRAVVAAGRLRRLAAERREVYPDLPPLRLGINVGEVLLAPSWESSGFSVAGDAVNVASRLCSSAESGGGLVASTLTELVPDVEWPPPVAVPVKNREAAVLASPLPEVLPERASERAVSASPFVGREEELGALREALGARRPVVIVGEPGVGKSRLLREVLAHHPGQVVRVSCPAFEPASSLAVLSEVARALLPTADEQWQPAPVVLRRLRRLTGQPVETDDPDDDTELARAVADLCDVQPPETVIAVEDLQWASGATTDLLRRLVDSRQVRVLGTSRTDPALAGLTPLPLRPLAVEETSALVTRLLPGADEDLVRFFEDRCGGVALFIEQCAQLLLESGAVAADASGHRLVSREAARQVPTAMRLFVSARLDLLEPFPRQVIATASALGDRVDARLLLALHPGCEPAVEELVMRGLLRWQAAEGRPPVLAFRHALVRDVAYETELRSRRAEVHVAASDWYAVLPALEQLEAQALHLEQAVALGDADCGLVRRAVAALVQWGQSIVHERPAESLRVLRRALSIIDAYASCDIDALTLQLALAEACELAGDEGSARVHAETAARLSGERDDVAAAAQAHLLLGRALVLGDPEAADRVLAEAALLWDRAEDPTGVARVSVERAILKEGAEGWQALLDAHEQAFRVGQRYGDKRLMVSAAQQLAFHSVVQGPVVVRRWAEALESVLRPDDASGRSLLLLADAIVANNGHERTAAADRCRRALEASDALGNDWQARNALLLLGEALLQEGSLAQAAEVIDDIDRRAVRRPNELLSFSGALLSALLHARTGRPVEAEADLARAAATAERNGLGYQREHAMYEGLVSLERGDFELASRRFDFVARADDELLQPFSSVRPRLWQLSALVAARQRVSLTLSSELRLVAREQELHNVDLLLRLWLDEHDLLNGFDVDDLEDAESDDLEVQALLAERRALRSSEPAHLLDAAALWGRLGANVWTARALLWFEQATGQRQEAAWDLLAALRSPEGLGEVLKAQVAHLT